MDERTFDALTIRAAGAPDRRSLLLLGGTGLAAALARPGTASAATSAKKKCKKQKKQCRQAVQNVCADLEEDEQECLDALLPCCASCKVKAGVLCVLEVFLNREET